MCPVLYKKPNGTTEIDVRLDGDTIRLNQNQIAELFNVSVKTINEHLVNIYKTGELSENGTCAKIALSSFRQTYKVL